MLLAGLRVVADSDSRKVVQLPQVGWHVEVRKIHVLWVEVLHPVNYIDNLVQQVHPFLLDGCLCFVLLIKLEAAEL